MNENTTPDPARAVPTPGDAELASRRQFLSRMSLTLGAACAGVVGAPALAFTVAPLFRRAPYAWRTVGQPKDFDVGKTINVTFEDPSPLPWAGVTARAGAWLRREPNDTFTAFSVHCTHLGCPVRWMPDANLFMCPCHGGVYYADGTVAAGPPPLPLFRYDVRVLAGNVQVKAAPIPITTTL
ncbi:ubiquinol-cytochrome c reductase iron-sulfur subunit [Opitutus sp. ER46]|uniref:QcrA and Rieske domain-containing protein n=1 Tax=Opitutus sp. ER46 TaxID=2161864 RepID=UPI000D30BD78|nr:ubiquinol-cytochrome c reductase iron-sulfur subunit [Opitutus sp. ER46]PTX91033.1 (2Fe-2S)-binding protein [Opitutus sp. ER46]